MNLNNFFKKIFRNNNETITEFNSSTIHVQNEKRETIKEKNYIDKSIQNPINRDTLKAHKDVSYSGKWKAKDMDFVQLWNNDVYEPQKRNYSRRMLIFRTPNYKSFGDEYGGSDNGREETISLTVNVEEGKVFLENYIQASKIFESKIELELFMQEAQNKFHNELDMGKGTSFLFGWGGCMASLQEYENSNIQYIPIVFPDNEKFCSPNYRKKVEWSLIEKGAIMINSKEGKSYLAVIQRKNKPRNLNL